MTYTFLSMIGLFLLLAVIVSLGLSLATSEDNLKTIMKIAVKNLWFLCLMVLGISLFSQILRAIF